MLFVLVFVSLLFKIDNTDHVSRLMTLELLVSSVYASKTKAVLPLIHSIPLFRRHLQRAVSQTPSKVATR